MTTILLLGAKGMLGSDFREMLFGLKQYHLVSLVAKKITQVRPQIIINAAAYTNVDQAETESETAKKINGQAVGFLAKMARQNGALFVHISTDYVFGQEKLQGYQESDFPRNPLNVYGQSKLLGENLLLEEAKKGLKYYLIRTSWLFGPYGKNFVQTMLDLAKTQTTIKIVNDQWGRPTYTCDLVKTVNHMLQNNFKPGIYHFTNLPTLTWYRLAILVFRAKKKEDPRFLPPQIVPIKSKEFSRPAQRPHFSILLNTKLPQGRNIQKALQDYFKRKKEVK